MGCFFTNNLTPTYKGKDTKADGEQRTHWSQLKTSLARHGANARWPLGLWLNYCLTFVLIKHLSWSNKTLPLHGAFHLHYRMILLVFPEVWFSGHRSLKGDESTFFPRDLKQLRVVWTLESHTLFKCDLAGEGSQWEGLLLLSDVSTTWAEVTFRVK